MDDSKALLAMLRAFLEEEGYRITTALSGEEALSLADKKRFHLVILDIQMPGKSGLDVLSEIKKIDLKSSVIIMTAYGTTQTAIEAMRRGAYDYITKPFDHAELKKLIKNALEAGRLMKESVSLQTKKEETSDGVCIIGNAPTMQDIYKTIGKVTEGNATVLIRGESGTGKELVARALYQNSLRRDNPFLAVNCAAIPESLLESELFGHERGAFTGAVNKRIGKFQQCDGGTIFLDEIGDMSLSAQTKMLRVLQEHTFEPVGSEKTVKVDVRVIASTNKDLWRAIEEGQFREDLYYRLKVVTIYMPPLKHRLEDIPLLVDYFVEKFNKALNKNIGKVSPGVVDRLMKYHWPGNVRELENAIQTAMVMSKEEVLLADDFSLFSQGGQVAAHGDPGQEGKNRKIQDELKPILRDYVAAGGTDFYKDALSAFEKSLIELVLEEVLGNQTEAAKKLGISRNTLRTRMKEYGIMPQKA